MENLKGNMVFDNQKFYICIFVIISTLWTVSGELASDTGLLASDTGYKSAETTKDDLKTLWELYILPRLELDLKKKVSDWLHEGGDQDISIPDRLSAYEYENDQENSYQTGETQPRLKRIGMAGLENLDLMTKTLHPHRLPMSVSNMNNNRLQMLMRAVGRRRK